MSCARQQTSNSYEPSGEKETDHRRQRAERLVASNQSITNVDWLKSLDDDIAWIERDPVEEISKRLNQSRKAGKNIKKLHIVAHGSNGEIKLGNTLLTNQYLEKSCQALQNWQLESIYLWSCNLGKNTNLLSTFESLTGAEVFASKSIIDRENTSIESNKGNTTYLDQAINFKEIKAWQGNLATPANSYVTVHTGHIDNGANDYFRYYGPGDGRNGAGVAILQSMPWWGNADLAEQWALNSHYSSPNLNIDGGTGGDQEQVAFAYDFYLWGATRNTRYLTQRKPDDWHNFAPDPDKDEVGQNWSGGYAVDISTFSGITINQTGPRNGTDLLTTEAGGSSTFTVVLDNAPTANVTATITGLKTQEGSLDTDTLTFTTANWNTPQTITVTGVDDNYANGDYTYSLIATASNSGGYAGTERAATNIKNIDDDTNGVTIAQTGTTDGSGNLLTTEAGGTSTFTAVLNAQPTADVTVSLSGNDTTEDSLSTNTLTFTNANWDTPQTVTVTGVNDTIVDGDITTTLTATASNSGNYAGTESDTTTVKNTDNETSGITITKTGTNDGSGNLLTTEAGGSSTFTVVLDAEPTANVTVSLTGNDATENTLNSSSLTFTTGNWNTAQTVTATGADDDIDDGDIITTLTATANNAGGYAGNETSLVTVKNTDDDSNGITISQTGTTDGSGNLLTTEAGAASTYSVVLDAQPTSNVTVTTSGNDATENSLSTDSLTFTSANWNTAQTITVTGIDDDIVDGDITTTLTVTANKAGGYAGNESATTTVKNTDDDTDGDRGVSTNSGRENNNTDQTPSSPNGLISNIDNETTPIVPQPPSDLQPTSDPTTSALSLNSKGNGFKVTGSRGLWIQLEALQSNAAMQNSLEIINSFGYAIGSIGATSHSTNLGRQEIHLETGYEIIFHQISQNIHRNPLPNLQIQSNSDHFTLHLDDTADGDNDYDDLIIKVTASPNPLNPTTIHLASEQKETQDSILNLSQFNGQAARLRLTLHSDCTNTSQVAFVKLTGNELEGFSVNGIASTAGELFEQTVRDNLINPSGTELSISGQSIKQVEWTLDQKDAGFYAPVFINKETNNLFTYGAASTQDKNIHIKNLGSNFFGYEDTISSQGSDWDFNDITMLVEMI